MQVPDEQIARLTASVEYDPKPLLLVFFRRTAVAATVVLACGIAGGLYPGSGGRASAPSRVATDGGISTPIPVDFRFDRAGADERRRRASRHR